jgi:hypothetical protein
MSLMADPVAAERLARAILDDITLYNDEKIRASRDLVADLATEVEEGRTLFRSRADPAHHHVFEDELLAWRGRAPDRARDLAGAGMDGSRLLIAIGAAVALAAVVAWLMLHSR